MERSSDHVRLLGHKMAAATELMSESAQENAQALGLLVEVVDKLRGLIVAGRSPTPPAAAAASRTPPPPTRPLPVLLLLLVLVLVLVQLVPCVYADGLALSRPRSGLASPKSGPKNKAPAGPRSDTPTPRPTSPTAFWVPGRRAKENIDSPFNRGSRRASSCPRVIAGKQASRGRRQPLGTEGPCQGATIRRNDVTGEIFIARVIHGGLADRSGLLYAGDRLVEVNGLSVEGLEPEQIIQILARSHGTIMFKVVPISDRPVNSQTTLYVRAMADYCPQQDPAIPCAEAGMSFRKGDVLEVVDQTDALWWQARKLPSTSGCAGLIPSTSLLKRKQREFWWSQPSQSHTCINI
ncbi:hypothetical protein ANANG_G00273110 [Anguilla anguilla]|uniref:Uncharacterized protein n=1 Tax=Anguilla anguilla TaxID=7936 RepID=A0A9D3LR65_ANGAN|nr:hypothetical protein ANANG_G00273110 [Anguilla anguilla]